jgi:hypothetical protein
LIVPSKKCNFVNREKYFYRWRNYLPPWLHGLCDKGMQWQNVYGSRGNTSIHLRKLLN